MSESHMHMSGASGALRIVGWAGPGGASRGGAGTPEEGAASAWRWRL